MSTDSLSGAKLRLPRSEPTSPTKPPRKQSTGRRLGNLRLVTQPERILDFDCETLAAGFADPDWVPQKITCVAWSWIGSDDVQVSACGPMGFFKPDLRRAMLKPFLADLREATMVTGHNLLRFDLPVLNAECLRLGLDPLGPMLVQDTIRVVKTKGFKKGQDNLGALLGTAEQKLALSWQDWEDAYEADDWPTVKERAMGDVRAHKQVREKMLVRGWLRPRTVWRP